MTAQKNTPKWADKTRKAVLSITTYAKDGKQIATTNGFFISESGEALSGYESFKGASRATGKDSDGKEYEVKYILGADELYDVIKLQFSVPKKVPFLTLAQEPMSTGASVFMMPYSAGKTIALKNGSITEVSNLKDSYKYYKIAIPYESSDIDAPLLDEAGQVFALTQPDASGKTDVAYGLSASFAVNTLNISPTDFINSSYRNINIPKAWPKEISQATVALYLLANAEDAKSYLNTINSFIETFPDAPDGYLARANQYAYGREKLSENVGEQKEFLKKAIADIESAGKISGKKAETDFNKAKLIFAVIAGDSTIDLSGWNEESAMALLESAINAENIPAYHQLKGDILFNKAQFPDAYEEYMIINNSDLASSASWYMAAKSLENTKGFNIGDVITLLDKAIEKSEEGHNTDAATFILERIDWRLRLSQYAEAIADYDKYYSLMNGQVSPQFYYMREQARFRSGDMEGALKDIQSAISADADNPDYYAEEASIYLKQQKYTEALASLEKALKIAPDYGACYRLQGLCYIRMNKKDDACRAFNKALEYKDPLADKLIKEHCK